MKTHQLLAICLLGAAAVAAAAQIPPPPASFAAATIRPATTPQVQGAERVQIRTGIHYDPQRLTANFATLKDMLANAYGLKPYQVIGPGWITARRFELNAVTAAPLSPDQMNRLLQTYLSSQFHLKLHRETKSEPVYALVIAPGGPKLKAAAHGPNAAAAPGATSVMIGPNGAVIAGDNDTLTSLAGALTPMLDRPVLDETGLHGAYDIHLEFRPDMGALMAGARAAGLPTMKGPIAAANQTPQSQMPGVSIFSALPQQLGLKLEARHGPVPLLVVDSGNPTPEGQ